MTIYYFGVYDTNGGLENFAKNLISSIIQKDINISFKIITTCSKISFEDYFERTLKCEIIKVDDPHRHPIRFYQQMLDICKKAKASNDIVHLNVCSFRNYLLFKACKKTKVKTIVVGHYTKIDDGKMPWLHYLNSKLFLNDFLCISNSPEVTNFMFSKKQKIHFINNGVNQEKFLFSKKAKIEKTNELGIGDSFVVGQVGRISPEKNQIFSIKVIEQVKERIPNIVLLLVGKEFDSEPRKYVLKNNLSKYVKFIGSVSEGIEKYYSCFDVCLLPSKNEGMSLSLLECVTNGVQSIFSNAVPKLEVSCNYIHYLDLDIKQWSDLIVELSSKNKHHQSGIKNTVYDLNVCAESYISIYKKIEEYI